MIYNTYTGKWISRKKMLIKNTYKKSLKSFAQLFLNSEKNN